jgi:uncharacterized protein YukE
MTNSLIASPTAAPGPSWDAAMKSLVFVNSGESLARDLASNNVAGALADTAMVALDAASVYLDPIAALASSAASFLLNYMPPLVETLDYLVGNPRSVEAMSTTWSSITRAIEAARDDLDAAVTSALDGWSGPAAESYRAFVDVFTQLMQGVGYMATAVAGGLQGASAVIQLIRTIVVQLVSSLVGALISLAVEELASLGAGTPVVIVQATTKIADTAVKSASWTDQLVSTIEKLAKDVSSTNKILTKSIPGIRTAGKSLTLLSYKSIYKDAEAFVDQLYPQHSEKTS